MDTVTWDQILNEAANIHVVLGKSMNPTILPPTKGK